MALHTIPIPDTLFVRLRRESVIRRRPIDEIAHDALDLYLIDTIETEDENERLPAGLVSEMRAMSYLTDKGLWIMARSSLDPAEWGELKELTAISKERKLSDIERQRQDELIAAYDAMLLRRAYAANLLMERGYDVSDPSIFN